MSEKISQRVLILAATRRDAEASQALFSKAHIESEIIRNADGLFSAIGEGVGSLLIAKEALNTALVTRMTAVLNAQPSWSFLPIVILVGAGDLSSGRSSVLNLLEPLRNSTLIERPVRTKMLLSIIRSSLADRQRQYSLRDTFAELEESKTVAIAANEAKSSFLANMSHEIRTPLGSILGFAELLSDSSVSESERARFTETIRRNGVLLSSIINDVLDLAKVEAGHLAIERLEVTVRELIDDVVTAFQATAATKNIKLVSSLAQAVPEEIVTDPIRFKQILINVVSNAIKFTFKGSVQIEAGTENENLIVRVKDTGIGLTSEQANRLFQPFSQADNSITRRFGGTGLGLALSKKLATALGGNLELTATREGAGSIFTFSVPLQHAELKPRFQQLQAPLPLDLSGRRVLIADDSNDNQFLITRILAKVNAEISSAENGEKAVEIALSNQPDLVLMDVQMPIMDGHEATRALRARGFTKPIIALTAHALKEDRDRAFAAGCNDYLTKPIERAKLFEAIQRLL